VVDDSRADLDQLLAQAGPFAGISPPPICGYAPSNTERPVSSSLKPRAIRLRIMRPFREEPSMIATWALRLNTRCGVRLWALTGAVAKTPTVKRDNRRFAGLANHQS